MRKTNRLVYLALVVLSLAYVLVANFLLRDVGYVYEEIFPHQRVLPRILVKGYPLNHGPESAVGALAAGESDFLDVHLSHPEPSDGCSIVLADQWPTFSVACGEQVYPILSETYQGNWMYYLSYAWQAVGGDSVAMLRFLSTLLGVAGLWLIFFVVRRESDDLGGLAAAVLLTTSIYYIMSFALAFWFETFPAVLALAGYAALQRRRLALSVFLLGLGVALKATVGILVFAFIPLWWTEWSCRGRQWKLLIAAAGAFALTMLPFVVHELWCVVRGAPHSSFFATLAARGDSLSSGARFPGIVLDSFFWLVFFGGNLNGISRPVFGIETMPWPRVDLCLLFVGALGSAVWRWRQGRALGIEKAALLCVCAAFTQSVLLYSTSTDIQAFAYVTPFIVALNALFIVRVGRRYNTLLVPIALVVFASQVAEPLLDSGSPVRLIASRSEQERVCRALSGMSEEAQVVTTSYNHLGMVEHCTGNRIRPVHAFFLLSPGTTGDTLRSDLAVAADYLLDRYPEALFLLESSSSRVWEAREGSVQRGEEELTTLRLEAFVGAARRREGEFQRHPSRKCDTVGPELWGLRHSMRE